MCAGILIEKKNSVERASRVAKYSISMFMLCIYCVALRLLLMLDIKLNEILLYGILAIIVFSVWYGWDKRIQQELIHVKRTRLKPYSARELRTFGWIGLFIGLLSNIVLLIVGIFTVEGYSL
jgi:hypothetical protein